ncbi:hypothetical protein V5799_022631 [Amblyomma americanum]|uniref:glutamine synthetase n=2 Tax=Amblyomma americanum TaxID=6943 RepID=A0AAQ4FLD0_AMBAM
MQEYVLLGRDGVPIGWSGKDHVLKRCQTYFYAVGAENIAGRQVADAHAKACAYAGVKFHGTNAEATISQWEYQIGPLPGVEAGDHLWISRYILQRVAEDFDVVVSFEPCPFRNNQVPGSAGHINFSTKVSRGEGGLEWIMEALEKLKLKNDQHLAAYDPRKSEPNQQRLKVDALATPTREFVSGFNKMLFSPGHLSNAAGVNNCKRRDCRSTTFVTCSTISLYLSPTDRSSAAVGPSSTVHAYLDCSRWLLLHSRDPPAEMAESRESVLRRYLDLEQPDDAVFCTYVFVDGTLEKVRSKIKTLDFEPKRVEDCPVWTFCALGSYQWPDGGPKSEAYLVPVALFRDPFFGGRNKIVLCEVLQHDRKPMKTNTRRSCYQAMQKAADQEPWFGIEQEYVLTEKDGQPLGWPRHPSQTIKPLGPYLYGVGADVVEGRYVSDAHYKACTYAGVKMAGTNCEGILSQYGCGDSSIRQHRLQCDCGHSRIRLLAVGVPGGSSARRGGG